MRIYLWIGFQRTEDKKKLIYKNREVFLLFMNFIKELERGMHRNSFEDDDRSLNNFPYMSGYLQSTENKKIMIYQWDEKENRNKRIWIEKEKI